MIDLAGLWVTTVTPYAADGSIDVEMVERNVRYLVDNGVRRLVPAGNTGEYFALQPTEVVELVKATRRSSSEAMVLAGVGGSLETCLSLTESVIAAGADGVLLHEPIHTHVSAAGLELYYREICAAALGQVMVYKRQRVLDSLLLQLTDAKEVWGVKYANNDLMAFQRTREATDNGVWICGTSECWAPFFHLLGADGFTSGLANAAPALPVAMESAFEAGDLAQAMQLRELARPFEELRGEEDAGKSTPAVREVMGLAGFQVGAARPPLGSLTASDKARVREIWSRWREAGVVTHEGALAATPDPPTSRLQRS